MNTTQHKSCMVSSIRCFVDLNESSHQFYDGMEITSWVDELKHRMNQRKFCLQFKSYAIANSNGCMQIKYLYMHACLG